MMAATAPSPRAFTAADNATNHEPPYMVEGEQQALRTGMSFSIEPRIYLSGRFGVRIEDIVAVTDTGGRRLNNTDRHPRSVS